jgi:glycosyltransferase involved in cell wall biosynthesis
MQRRLKLPPEKVRVVHNGIQLNGFEPAAALPQPPVLGYFARMCEDKGLGLAVDTFIVLKRSGKFPQLKFKVGGGCGPSDEKYVAIQKEKLAQAGVLNDVSFHPNLTREEKLEFFRTLTVFSTPAMYGEAFGLYVIEALAAGVPVVQPRHAGFPELVELTGGGLVTDPNAQALATGIESLLADPAKAQAFGRKGRASVEEKFAVDRMASKVAETYQQAIARFAARSPSQPVIA